MGFFESTFPEEVRRSRSMPTFISSQIDKHFAGRREVTLQQEGQSPSAPSSLASGCGQCLGRARLPPTTHLQPRRNKRQAIIFI